MDGSRIEGSHKAWNSLQRSHSSGIEVYTALAFDFFHRRNIRIGWSRVENKRHGINCYDFVESTYSSHHIQLVNYTANSFNAFLEKVPADVVARNRLGPRATLPKVTTHESMGLVESEHTITFGGLVEAPTDLPESGNADNTNAYMLADIESEISEMDRGQLIQSLNVDEHTLHIPLASNSTRPVRHDGSTTNSLGQSQKRKERDKFRPTEAGISSDLNL